MADGNEFGCIYLGKVKNSVAEQAEVTTGNQSQTPARNHKEGQYPQSKLGNNKNNRNEHRYQE